MKKRRINFTVEIEDSDFIEFRLIKSLEGLLGKSMIDYKILPDTKELYDSDEGFRAICSEYKRLKKAREDYIWHQKK